MHFKSYIFFWFTILFCTSCSTEPKNSFTNSFDKTDHPKLIERNHANKYIDSSWWLNSGGYLYQTKNGASTVQGKLSNNDRFRLLYAKSNPLDTDNGYRPQNLLRLVTNSKFKNFTQQVFFNIKKINLSDSPNRNQSNGVLLFHRYQNGDNLYYIGIRVDGYAVVKKKLHGKYYTLKSTSVYSGNYNRDTLPNLLPINHRIGIKTKVSTNAKGYVDIIMYLNDSQLGPGWTQILQIEDTGADAGLILKKGHAGIRSDFMDVFFDDYQVSEIQN
ncbi:MAG: hypothetical protein L3J59_04320 [Methylococcaceae bacterium]|nr:hypothetical protein [Methylococcaceae bacterium]